MVEVELASAEIPREHCGAAVPENSYNLKPRSARSHVTVQGTLRLSFSYLQISNENSVESNASDDGDWEFLQTSNSANRSRPPSPLPTGRFLVFKCCLLSPSRLC